jgi:methyl-accepting chemotaxis protein-1 (serine sensor receptor)
MLLALLLVLMVVVGMAGLYGMNKTDDALDSVYEECTIPLGQVDDIQAILLDNRLQISFMLLDPRPEEIKCQTEILAKELQAAVSKFKV